MSAPPLPDDTIALLRKPNPSTITTLRSDGQPVSAATWYLWENDKVLVNMDEGRKRLDHIRRDPRVTLTVLDNEDWYTHVTLLGRVTELREDTGLTDIDRLAEHYLGTQYHNRDRKRLTALIEIDRWHGWGSHKDSNQAG
ncbi:PPOX class F420-dependent oxidoreductase [Saccharopolyspora gloriosae]|uniref:PPOX class F420-dependent oxidoreductase n=1 Tax=Saccharopolyspora gloriosae TaxID=455344 RepID=UPI001FB7F75C|nr:PPOX class F420-dependent oxidoreductase [Saccharopolyspora gloriosae]